MQRDPRASEAFAGQRLQRPLMRIECVSIDTARLERIQHRVAAHQRHLALRGIAAKQNGHLAEFAGKLGAMNGGFGHQQAHTGLSDDAHVRFEINARALVSGHAHVRFGFTVITQAPRRYVLRS